MKRKQASEPKKATKKHAPNSARPSHPSSSSSRPSGAAVRMGMSPSVSNHGEVKVIDTSTVDAAAQVLQPILFSDTTNWALTAPQGARLLNAIQQGTQVNQRVGNRVELANIQGNLRLRPTTTAASYGAETLRIALIYDKQPSGVFPASFGAIFGSISGTGTGFGGTIDSPPNLDNRDRFMVIRDWRRSMPAYTVAAGPIYSGIGPTDQVNFEIDLNSFSKKVRGLVCNYIGTANPVTVSNIATGALYLVAVTDNAQMANVGTPPANRSSWQIQGEVRVRYKD